ncbi:MAG: hypothetical protein M3139_05470 [Bacteroidota bacterium]|nr:hypothetical protein [Bacteroidota bacterium]
MATIKVNTKYPESDNGNFDPVFEEGFAYELEARLNKKFEKNNGNILMNYFPDRLTDNFEINANEDGNNVSMAFIEIIKKISGEFFRKEYNMSKVDSSVS